MARAKRDAPSADPGAPASETTTTQEKSGFVRFPVPPSVATLLGLYQVQTGKTQTAVAQELELDLIALLTGKLSRNGVAIPSLLERAREATAAAWPDWDEPKAVPVERSES